MFATPSEKADKNFQIIQQLLIEVRQEEKTILDLSGLDLVQLPKGIWELIHLKILILENNQLIELPKEIGNLINLERLELSQNRLASIPPEISKLTKLVILRLRSNQLSNLPPTIEQLTGLITLDLAENQLTSLPQKIGELNHLVSLDLGKNKLTSLPSGFRWLGKLKYLNLNENSLPIPPEILAKIGEPQAFLDYYFARPIKKPLNEIKLLVVGQGSVGKTSIIHRVLDNTYNPKENKTEGIDIRRHKFRANNSSYTINVWDFGGQEIMHATHQFFLTKRSLYLLVLDARLTQEENRVEYWLKIIQSFGSESPVLIVGNKIDQHPLDIDRTGLGKKYPNIVGVLEASAATNAGIDALKAEIAKQVDTLPHVHDLLPETWFTVKSKLEELGKTKNFFTQDEYIALCDTYDIEDNSSKHTLIGFLHDLGVVLHFQDDPRLEALGILNPQWVTNGVYKILNSHELFQNKGQLTLPLLNKILNLPEYPSEKRLFIVDMMKKFELCYDIESDKSFLIPDLLPKDEPFTGEWYSALAFQYHYNVLPSSINSRFIVRMNVFIHKTIWRSGVVLKSGGNTALIKADTEDRKIYIWVAGDEPTRRDFLSAIRMEFDAIHKTIAKIEVTEKIPLLNVPGASPVDYEFLLRLEREGRTTFPIQAGENIIDIDVKGLLDGITTQAQRRTELNPVRRMEAVTINVPTTPKPTSTISIASRNPKKTDNKFVSALKAITSFPKYLGRFVFDLFGRHDSAESSSIILGWIFVFVFILVLQGFINSDNIVKVFANIWRFFNPIK